MEERGTSTERRLKADGAHASSVFFNIKMKWKMEMWTENKQRRHTYNLKRHNTYNGLLCLHLYLKPPPPPPPPAGGRPTGTLGGLRTGGKGEWTEKRM